MKIGILGCGWIGSKLSDVLLNQNHEVYTSNTSSKKNHQMALKGCQAYVIDFLKPNNTAELSDLFKKLDAILISVSVSRSTDPQHQESIFNHLKIFLKGYTGKTILLSTTGIYPQENKTITEDTYNPEQLHPQVMRVEQIMSQALPQINILRLGGLLGGERLMKHWFLDQSQISQPHRAVNHVHYEDVITIIQQLIKSEITGEVFNVVAPEHPTKKEVFLGEKIGKKTIDNQRIIDGHKLQTALNYNYMHPNPICFS